MKSSSNFLEPVLLAIMLLLSPQGQTQPLAETGERYAFIKGEENILLNDAGLERFFERLRQLQSADSGTVNVIHIGDSHIQADFLTEVVRKNLQSTFGNAGRGLIVPYRVAGTNEPFNFRTSSSGIWTSRRIVHSARPMPVGIGGITVSTSDENGRFAVTMKDDEIDYRFNRITLFLANDRKSYSLAVRDSFSTELTRYTPTSDDNGPHVIQLDLPGWYRHVEVGNFRESEIQTHTTLYGLSFENGSRGILYHAIGVNGARYEHYNKAELFSKQTTSLKPDLIIISLGTNESVEYPLLKSDFPGQLKTLVESLTANNPESALLLVTPPDAFLKKSKPNPGIEIIRRQILEYAAENGISFWDMHKVTGGSGAAHLWKEMGLLRPDGIHFTRDGYALQGKLLYEAIMKSYGKYVANRYP